MKKLFLIPFIFCNAYAADLSGTQTEQNLITAIRGEHTAQHKYEKFADVANSQKLQSIGKIFIETANMEKEHGDRFEKLLGRKSDLPDNPITVGTTAENLRDAINGEHNENSSLYIDMAKTARTEGFDEIADDFTNIASAEKYHETRYMTILENLENKTYFEKAAPVNWKCTNCGYHTTSPNAPDKCPACEHDQGYFIEIREEYF